MSADDAVFSFSGMEEISEAAEVKPMVELITHRERKVCAANIAKGESYAEVQVKHTNRFPAGTIDEVTLSKISYSTNSSTIVVVSVCEFRNAESKGESAEHIKAVAEFVACFVTKV